MMLRSLQQPDLDTGEQRHVDATVGSDVEDPVVAIPTQACRGSWWAGNWSTTAAAVGLERLPRRMEIRLL